MTIVTIGIKREIFREAKKVNQFDWKSQEYIFSYKTNNHIGIKNSKSY